MRQKLVMGNWKMNGNAATIRALLHDLVRTVVYPGSGICAVFPPTVYLKEVGDILTNSPIQWGAQNVYKKDAGAFTGEVSAPMLRDYGCQYVLVGHSERRQLFGEDEKFVSEKFHHVKDHDMIPVLCIGETLFERKNGQTEITLARQLSAVLQDKKDAFSHCVIAYEPIWAIGTGVTATPVQAQEVHAFIREWVSQHSSTNAQELSLLYGGSMNESNAESLLSMPDVDGGLIGGASLHARSFLEILKCINWC